MIGRFAEQLFVNIPSCPADLESVTGYIIVKQITETRCVWLASLFSIAKKSNFIL